MLFEWECIIYSLTFKLPQTLLTDSFLRKREKECEFHILLGPCNIWIQWMIKKNIWILECEFSSEKYCYAKNLCKTFLHRHVLIQFVKGWSLCKFWFGTNVLMRLSFWSQRIQASTFLATILENNLFSRDMISFGSYIIGRIESVWLQFERKFRDWFKMNWLF